MTPVNEIMIGSPVYILLLLLSRLTIRPGRCCFIAIITSESNIYLDRIELDYYYSVKDKNHPPSNSYLLRPT